MMAPALRSLYDCEVSSANILVPLFLMQSNFMFTFFLSYSFRVSCCFATWRETTGEVSWWYFFSSVYETEEDSAGGGNFSILAQYSI